MTIQPSTVSEPRMMPTKPPLSQLCFFSSVPRTRHQLGIFFRALGRRRKFQEPGGDGGPSRIPSRRSHRRPPAGSPRCLPPPRLASVIPGTAPETLAALAPSTYSVAWVPSATASRWCQPFASSLAAPRARCPATSKYGVLSSNPSTTAAPFALRLRSVPLLPGSQFYPDAPGKGGSLPARSANRSWESSTAVARLQPRPRPDERTGRGEWHSSPRCCRRPWNRAAACWFPSSGRPASYRYRRCPWHLRRARPCRCRSTARTLIFAFAFKRREP